MLKSIRYAASLLALIIAGLLSLAVAALAALAATAGLAQAKQPDPVGAPSIERRAVLRNMLIQDCGSCHGLTMRGGLGPALLPADLSNKPVAYLETTILDGRPGTAMPPWRPFLSDQEALWMAQQLKAGLR
jgi:cytochrome c55X